MRVEIPDGRQTPADRGANSSRVDDIETDQLNKRLVSVLNGISSKHYNRREHRKRLEDIQNDLDAAFAVKPERARLEAKDDMAGPAYRKILAQRKRAKQLGQPYKPSTSVQKTEPSRSTKRLAANLDVPPSQPSTKQSGETPAEGESVDASATLIHHRGVTGGGKLPRNQPFK